MFKVLLLAAAAVAAPAVRGAAEAQAPAVPIRLNSGVGMLGNGKPRGGSASASDCGAETSSSIHFDSLSIKPDDVEKNAPVYFDATGTLAKPTTSGSYKLVVKLNGMALYTASDDICGETQVVLPAGVGTINVHGLECPASPGSVEWGLDVTLPTIAPNGDYDIGISATDGDGDSLMCVDVALTLD